MSDDADEMFADVDGSTELGEDETPSTLFPNVYVFVRDHLADVIERDVGSHSNAWCARWFEHPEAVSRLEALWKAFEALRQDPGTGASSWWRDHADPTMAALFAGQGVFRRCVNGKHSLGERLPMEEPPEWLIHSGGSEDS